ncbi:MAG: hypothetical protein GY714_22040 [Desulfobacterales bacterium]|nr:hypothetical protein [Desulfobacterales bacterium]MCP4160413.1 hypothetical protein [Deltaproteobacteria bacterium]
MEIANLNNISFSPEKSSNGLINANLKIADDDIISIKTDEREDAYLLLKGLATLSYPTEGTYELLNEKLDFSDYKNLLCAKKRIGYIGSDATMLSNRSIRQNLLLSGLFFKNDQSLEIDDETMALCEKFGIVDVLDKRPYELNHFHLHVSLSVREIMKRPKLLLMERPEDFIGYEYISMFAEDIYDVFLKDSAIVFFSASKYVRDTFKESEIEIQQGKLFQDLE